MRRLRPYNWVNAKFRLKEGRAGSRGIRRMSVYSYRWISPRRDSINGKRNIIQENLDQYIGMNINRSPFYGVPGVLALSALVLFLAGCQSNRHKTQLEEIDKTLRLSSGSISGQNLILYNSLNYKLADPTTAHVALRWSPPALKAKMLSSRAINCIDSIHRKMTASGSLSLEDKRILFDTLVDCRRGILTVFPDSLDPNGRFLAETRRQFRNHIPLLRDASGAQEPTLSFNEWADELFQDDTTITALTLDKLKIDVLLSEQAIARFCDINAVSTVDRFDRFDQLISINTQVAAPGDTIELTAGVAAYSVSVGPKITIAGKGIPINENGVAVYSFRASKQPGRYSIPVTIEFTKPDGQKATIMKNVRYRVRDSHP